MSADDTARGAVAITGATGFIGAHLLSRFDSLNQTTKVLVRGGPKRKTNTPKSSKIVRGSLSDRESMMSLFAGAQTCIHAAGATKSIDLNGFHAANVVGTYTLAACAAASGVKHFIYLSSQAARAPEISEYAASKAMSESALQSFRSDMKVTIIRPPAVIGPGDPMLKPMFDLIKAGWLLAPADPRVGARNFALISVRDLVDQIVSTVRTDKAADSLIEPCSIASVDWRQVADVASEVLARDVRLVQIWPSAMKMLGYLADGMAHLVRRPMPISHSKVRELLAADWTYEHAVQDGMNLKEILRDCLLDKGPE